MLLEGGIKKGPAIPDRDKEPSQDAEQEKRIPQRYSGKESFSGFVDLEKGAGHSRVYRKAFEPPYPNLKEQNKQVISGCRFLNYSCGFTF